MRLVPTVAFVCVLLHGAECRGSSRRTSGSRQLPRVQRAVIDSIKPFKIEDSASEQYAHKPNAKKRTIWYGPYRITDPWRHAINFASLNMNGIEHTVPLYLSPIHAFPQNATFLRIAAKLTKADLVSAMGSADDHRLVIKRLLLISATNQGVRELKCPVLESPIWDDVGARYLLLGSGEQEVVTEFQLPEGGLNSGFYHDSINSSNYFIAWLTSESDQQQDFFWRFQVDYLDGRVEGVKESELVSGPPKVCEKWGPKEPLEQKDTIQGEKIINATYELQQDGWIASMTGFMQHGGSEMNIKVNRKDVCTIKPIYGGLGGVSTYRNGTTYDIIKGMEVCKPFRVRKGNELFILSKYDYSAHPVYQNKRYIVPPGSLKYYLLPTTFRFTFIFDRPPPRANSGFV